MTAHPTVFLTKGEGGFGMSMGAAPAEMGGGILISKLKAGGAAEATGLIRPGSKILAVNGHDVSGSDKATIVGFLRQSDTVELVLAEPESRMLNHELPALTPRGAAAATHPVSQQSAGRSPPPGPQPQQPRPQQPQQPPQNKKEGKTAKRVMKQQVKREKKADKVNAKADKRASKMAKKTGRRGGAVNDSFQFDDSEED